MPSYVSHIIMARDIYNKIDNHVVSLDSMLLHCLGGDLSKYAKCRYETHHKYQKEFIKNICDYMKENDLVNDKDALGLLYGHICHYIMDETMHPLIKKCSNLCINNKRNHFFIEMYLDSYLVKKNGYKDISLYVKNIKFAKINKKISNLIDYVYIKTYKCYHLSFYYKFNRNLYKLLSFIYILFGFKFIGKMLGYYKFIINNKDVDLINKHNKIVYKGYLGKDISFDFDKLYDITKDIIIEYINEIDKYLNYK